MQAKLFVLYGSCRLEIKTSAALALASQDSVTGLTGLTIKYEVEHVSDQMLDQKSRLHNPHDS